MIRFLLTVILSCTISALFSQSRADSAVVNYLREHYDVNFSDDNSMVIFAYGEEKFDDLFKAIAQARHSVHLEYFNFRNDSISRLLFELLERKAAEGVEVRAMFDSFGNTSNNRPLKNKDIRAINARGIQLVEFDPIRFPYVNHALHRDHRKIVVIDGVIAYTGGMNVADYYITGDPAYGEWRDMHYRIEGTAVIDLQKVFIDTWNNETKQALKLEDYTAPTTSLANAASFNDLKPDTTATKGQKQIGVVDRVP